MKEYPNLTKAEQHLPFRNELIQFLEFISEKYHYQLVDVYTTPLASRIANDDDIHNMVDKYFDIDREACEREANELYQKTMFKGQE